MLSVLTKSCQFVWMNIIMREEAIDYMTDAGCLLIVYSNFAFVIFIAAYTISQPTIITAAFVWACVPLAVILLVLCWATVSRLVYGNILTFNRRAGKLFTFLAAPLQPRRIWHRIYNKVVDSDFLSKHLIDAEIRANRRNHHFDVSSPRNAVAPPKAPEP